MMPERIWNFWASRYEGLWAQHFALKPARQMVTSYLSSVAPHSSRILDAGCGVGQLAHELSMQMQSCRILAIDSNKSMIEVATKQHEHTNITYRCATIKDVCDDGPFDVIVSTNAFPYFSEKIQALRCMYSMLKNGGRLIMAQATMENLYDAIFLIFVRLTVSQAQYYSVCRLATMMKRVGFDMGKIQSMKRHWFIPSIYMVEGVRQQDNAIHL